MGMQIADGARRGLNSHSSTWHPPLPVNLACRMAAILRRQAVWRWACFLFIIFAGNPAVAQAANDSVADLSPGQMRSGSLLLKTDSGYSAATRVNTEIDARISGLVARVRVSQQFRNTGTEWVEGIYVFPLPDAAAVDRLRMVIGERIIEGEIREKAQAKKEYEAAKASGQTASLVEQERANLFTTSVANIAPGETISIEIEYLETLKVDEGSFSIRFPLTFTPRYIPALAEAVRSGSSWSVPTESVADAPRITPPVVTHADDHQLQFRAELSAGVPLEYIASRYHPISVSNTDEKYSITLSEQDVPLDHDLELTWKSVAHAMPRAMLFTESLQDKPHMLLMLLPPDEVSVPQQLLPREMILVIDTSGSMHGTSLDQAKRALALALDGLSPGDRFNVIQFNSVTRAIFRESVVASTSNIGIAKRYVAALEANGGTEMRPAILQALVAPASAGYLRQVIFVTDGAVGNEEMLFKLVEQHLGETRLFTVGIGSAPNGWFMRKAAEAGRGSFTFISALHEVNEKMTRLFRKLELPQVTDIAVEWPGGIVAQSYPQTIPDLYAGEPIFVKARLSGVARASDFVVVSGNSPMGRWSAEVPVGIDEPGNGIAALWARARIEDLMDKKRRGADEESIRRAVIDTAIEHHLVSRYTSLVAIDKTPVRPSGAALDKEQLASRLPYGQGGNSIVAFPATATSAGAHRLNGLILFALALLLLLFLRSTRHDAATRS